MSDIHAFILTFNEERHIARCLASLKPHCTSLLVIDSGSTDRTLAIAKDYGARVIEAPWINHATQVNRAIVALNEMSGWLLRVDADEVLEVPDGKPLSQNVDQQPADIRGVLLQRRIVFMGKRISWGGIEPSWQLRLWRAGYGQCEQRWMDEHMAVDGKIGRSSLILTDHNLNSLDWWTAKHNRYASLEAIETLLASGELPGRDERVVAVASPQARLKRAFKEHLYHRLPGGLRALAYVIYRYIVRLGFLDGMAGYYFHVLQGFWYRTLVDAKLTEIRAFRAKTNCTMAEAIQHLTGINPDLAP